MAFSMIRSIYDALHPPKRLNCHRSLWRRIIRQLHERGRGTRESGGLLLGRQVGDKRFITDFLPYDDVDPGALQGIIVFDASKMDVVWDYCEKHNLSVVADVHTHPGGYGQSGTDQDNPIIPQAGHIALIVPNYAAEAYGPGSIGLYEFRSPDRWIDHSRQGSSFMRLEWI